MSRAHRKLFNELWNEVARRLPSAWEITVSCDCSGSNVELIDPDGDSVKFASNWTNLAETVEDAIEAAEGYSKLPEWRPAANSEIDRADHQRAEEKNQ